MSNKGYSIAVLLLCLLLRIPVKGQEHETRIYYHRGYSNIDLGYHNNAESLDSLISIIRDLQSKDNLEAIELQAWASPEGKTSLNNRLARKRTDIIASWIHDHIDIPDSLIRRTYGGVGWDLLRDIVSVSDAGYKDKVVDIIDNVPVYVFDSKGNIISGRTKQLQDLQGGRVWWDMFERYFPEVRSCLAIVIKSKERAEWEEIPALSMEFKEKVHQTHPDTLRPEQLSSPNLPAIAHLIAIKSNLLEDLSLIPNVGVEFYLGNAWSIGANYRHGWWHNDELHRYWRLYGGELNLRKYFGAKAKESPFRGHHLGVYSEILTYDFELGGKGIMGGIPGGTIFDKFNYTFGVEYGYSVPIARNLNLDFSLGFGYHGGEYLEYLPMDDCYVWQSTNLRRYWGPTKAGVSIVWLLGNSNRKGGGR